VVEWEGMKSKEIHEALIRNEKKEKILEDREEGRKRGSDGIRGNCSGPTRGATSVCKSHNYRHPVVQVHTTEGRNLEVAGAIASLAEEREREFISQINGGLPDKAFAHRAGPSLNLPIMWRQSLDTS